jgi:hypothetical protein
MNKPTNAAEPPPFTTLLSGGRFVSRILRSDIVRRDGRRKRLRCLRNAIQNRTLHNDERLETMKHENDPKPKDDCVPNSGDAYEEIRAVAIQMCRVEPSRLKIVQGEKDETTEPAPDAHEFLKFDEQRLGRDFKLYAFMGKLQGSCGHALAEFAEVLMAIKGNLPKAFEAVRAPVVGWARFFDDDKHDAWHDLWG